MMLVPLYGFLKGDSIGLVLLVQDHDTVADVAACLQEAAACRVAPKPVAHVFRDGRRLDPELTVTQAGLQALDRVDVITEDAPP
ncbi:MAG TPA: toluene-4-monooxygenase system B family protein [Nevskiales bacterium]|nr:toluene-4-monooxygenase system B family protein [Nevskiales bacterium]